MKKVINITKATVVINMGADIVLLKTDLPASFPDTISSEPLMFQFQVQKGKGVEYVIEHFKINPTVFEEDC